MTTVEKVDKIKKKNISEDKSRCYAGSFMGVPIDHIGKIDSIPIENITTINDIPIRKKDINKKEELDKEFVKSKVTERLNNILEYIGANKNLDVNVQIQNFAWGSNNDSRNAYVDIALKDKNQKNKIDLKIEYIEKPENFIVLELNGKKLEGENLEKLFASRDNFWRKEL